MPLDAICLTALKNELEGRITGMKIEKIYQPERDQLLLNLRGCGPETHLLLSSGTGDARIHLTNYGWENPQSPPMFCMLLRKHLTGARICAVDQPPLERVINITLEAPDAMGVFCEKHLILELTGRCSNVILCGPDGIIIDCMRRVDSEMSEKRQILPGLRYRLPPGQDKLDPLASSENVWRSCFDKAPGDASADRWILDTFYGLSPLICREIVSRAYGETDIRLSEAAAEDGGGALIRCAAALMGDIREKKFTPYMLTDREGKPKDFSFTEITQYGEALNLERADDFSSLLDEFYTRRAKAEHMRQRASSLTKTVKNAYERVARKLELQNEELKKTFGRDRLREQGDIITANLHTMKPGMSVLRTTDFYSDDGGECEIRLDPLKSPQQNAAKYYKEYAKARNAESFLKEQITLGEGELEYLGSVLEEISRADGERGLIEIRRELVQTGYIKKQASGKKEKRPGSEPMRFVSSTGVPISVGRNNEQNDLLTLKQAKKSDVWLHVHQIHGAHVIISSAEPDDDTLAEAASLAALYSQGRGSGRVPVDYTRVKHVKKPAGGRPGMVIYTDYKTVAAEPDEETAERLRKK